MVIVIGAHVRSLFAVSYNKWSCCSHLWLPRGVTSEVRVCGVGLCALWAGAHVTT